MLRHLIDSNWKENIGLLNKKLQLKLLEEEPFLKMKKNHLINCFYLIPL